jgi:hypothetical protein
MDKLRKSSQLKEEEAVPKAHVTRVKAGELIKIFDKRFGQIGTNPWS